MPWQTSPPIHFPLIFPIGDPAIYNAAAVRFRKFPDTLLYTAADTPPRSPTHYASSGPCSTNAVFKAEQQTEVDSHIATYGVGVDPTWAVDPDGVGVGKYAIGSSNPYAAMLTALGLTTSST